MNGTNDKNTSKGWGIVTDQRGTVMTKLINTLKARPLITGTIVAAVIAGGAYTAGGSGATPVSAGPAPAVPVTVQTLATQNVRAWNEFSGRLQAVDSAEIRPEVSGRITKLLFSDSQNVKVGDILFVIDPRPYEAAVAKADADLASAKTNAAFAKLELDRAVGLRQSQAIAQRVYDERANAYRVAQATVQGAEAALKQASLDLEHAYVRSPIEGRVSRAEITVGNLVQAGPAAPLLTTVVANRSIYADFDVDEQTYLQSAGEYAKASDGGRKVPVQLFAQGDSKHAYDGYIQSFDNKLNIATGTIRARAKFDNPDGMLVPGMFVSVKLASGASGEALLVPQRALGSDQSKKFVYVVGQDNRVVYREVELGRQIDQQRVALHGLSAGERIIVDGLQHVRPDALVEPRDVAMAGKAPSGAVERQ